MSECRIQRREREGEKTEKQGRYFTQESESVPRPQPSETLIPPSLRPPSPDPSHPSQSRGISLRRQGRKAAQPGFDSLTRGHERPVGEASQPLHAQERRSNHCMPKLTDWLPEPDPPP